MAEEPRGWSPKKPLPVHECARHAKHKDLWDNGPKKFSLPEKTLPSPEKEPRESVPVECELWDKHE